MSTPCGGGVGRGEWWWGGGAAEGAAAATGVTSAKGAGGAGGATGGEGPGGGGGEGGGEGAEGCGGVRRAQICSSSRRSRHSRCSRRCVPRLASVSCSSMQRGSSSAAGRPSSYCSQSASCERLATAPHAAPARPRRGRRAWDRCAECRRSLSFHIQAARGLLPGPEGSRGQAGGPLERCSHKRTRTQTTRRWALTQRRHVSFEAIGRGTPSSERAGPALRRICARRAVGTFIGHRQRSRLHLSGAREVPLALVVGGPRNEDSRVILSHRRVVGQHWSADTSGVLRAVGGDR